MKLLFDFSSAYSNYLAGLVRRAVGLMLNNVLLVLTMNYSIYTSRHAL